MGHANLLEGLQYYSRCGMQKIYRPYPGAEEMDAFADRLGEYKPKKAQFSFRIRTNCHSIGLSRLHVEAMNIS